MASLQPQAICNKVPCTNLRQSTYPLSELLGHTPISIVFPSVVVTTHLESVRSTIYFELKPGALSDDEQIGTT